jgi:hypothetical protein
MAISEVEKRRRFARDLVQHGAGFLDVLYVLDSDRKRASSGALVFVDSDFEGVAGLEHLNKVRIDAAIAAISTITSAFASGGFDDIFEAIRA